MKTLLHVTNTWVLAQLMHPVFFFHFIFLLDGEPSMVPLVKVLVCSLLFSLPAWWLCLFSFRPLQLLRVPLVSRLLLWKGIATAGIVVSLLLVCILLNCMHLFLQALFFSIPAIIAAWCAILVRFRQFRLFDPNEKSMA